MTSESNQRKAFRIRDNISLSVRVLDEEAAAQVELDFEKIRSGFAIMSHMHYERDAHVPTLRLIQRKYPEVASYLGFLEQQIEYLSVRLRDQEKITNNFEEVTVELSASGLSFETDDENIGNGSMLEVRMMLPPECIRIMALAEVSRVDDGKDRAKQVNLRFTRIDVEDEEAIIKHVHRLQMQNLRLKTSELPDDAMDSPTERRNSG